MCIRDRRQTDRQTETENKYTLFYEGSRERERERINKLYFTRVVEREREIERERGRQREKETQTESPACMWSGHRCFFCIDTGSLLMG